MKLKFGFILAAFLAAASITAGAQAEQWPSRPVTMICPYPPGGTSDIVARLFADRISEKIGQPIIVENRPGASGLIGSRTASRAAPDGYTFLLGNNGSLIVQPLLNKQAQIDIVENFTPVVRVALAYQFLGVNADLPIKNVQDLISLARSEPGKLNYGSAGVGSFGHFSGEMLQLQTGAKMLHVPFRGSAQALTALMAGQIQAMFDPLVLSQKDGGRVRVIGVSSPERLPRYPDIPTMREQGLANYDPFGWFGFFAPPGLPKTIATRFADAAAEAAKDPVIVKKLETDGLVTEVMMPEQFAAFVKHDKQKYEQIQEKTNIRIAQ